MKSNREYSIKQTLKYEGGYTNHPRDPGGPTNWGITIHDARMYWKPQATAADVKAMPLSVAVGIYGPRYWDAIKGDDLPSGVDFATYDFGVNSGVSRALKYLKASQASTAVQTVKNLCAKRLSFLRGLSTFDAFGKGWTRRVVNVEATGVSMALKASGKPAEDVKKDLGKEASKAGKQAQKDAAKTTGTAAGGTVGGTYSPDVSGLDLSTKIGIAVAVAIGIGVLAYFGWNWWINYQRQKAYNDAAVSISPDQAAA